MVQLDKNFKTNKSNYKDLSLKERLNLCVSYGVNPNDKYFTAPNGEKFKVFTPRGKIGGRRFNMVELLDHIAEYFQKGFTVKEVAELTGKDSDSISKYKKIISAFGKLEPELVEVQQREIEHRKESTNQMTERPEVKIWVEQLKQNGKSDHGRGFANMLNSVCQELKTTPLALCQLPIYQKDRQKGIEAIAKQMAIVKEGKTESAFYARRMAVRSWINFNGVTLPRGNLCPKSLSGKIVSSHGNYAHVRLDKNHLANIEKIFADKSSAQKFPYPDNFKDTEIVFRFGMATMSRKLAIFTARLADTVRGTDTDDLEIKVIERKLSHVEKQNRKKTILDPKLQKLIIERLDAGEPCLVGTKNQYIRFEDMSEIHTRDVRKFDKEIDKVLANLKKLYELAEVKESYFFEHPVHALRHSGCQLLLMASGWNTSLVAMVGDWLSTIEVEASYGRMPPDVLKNTYKEAFDKAKL